MMMAKMNGTAEDPTFELNDTLMSEATFDRKESLDRIFAFLRRDKLTGTLQIDVLRGGATRIRFMQKQQVDIV
jgi:hypothetical protein